MDPSALVDDCRHSLALGQSVVTKLGDVVDILRSLLRVRRIFCTQQRQVSLPSWADHESRLPVSVDKGVIVARSVRNAPKLVIGLRLPVSVRIRISEHTIQLDEDVIAVAHNRRFTLYG